METVLEPSDFDGRDTPVLREEFAGLVTVLEWVSAAIEVASIAILLVGAVRFIAGFVAAEFRRDGAERVRRINRERVELGRYILASLELFIVSDIIHTALSLALSDLLFLGVLVLIRAVISYFLDREMRQIREELES
jgi:uncharacterized membrane protein